MENMYQQKESQLVWYNVPIIRTGNTSKRVTWSDQLTDVRTISPRYKSNPFTFTQHRPCQHFSCPVGEACKMVQSWRVSQDPGLNTIKTSLGCSPQLKKVVLQAVNNNSNSTSYWKPDRNKLSLTLGNK